MERHEQSGISRRRQLAGALLAVAGLPLLTVLLTALRPELNLADDVLIYLIYLVAVVCVTVVGGFWPALFAAVDTPGGGLTVRVTLPALTSDVRAPLGAD